ncbi:Lytic murein transglycosylase [Fulvimarina pelagi HTCC2506]|uniref:Lytic murein transglycosylase n=1 Tax=Fulvimarina pelagi HTCC2506 TaxID=314231 RepID=Q0FY40_9HYPH|nr:Lytic murein transglycosylase [Fulvimarina pelagi HTCC2506]
MHANGGRSGPWMQVRVANTANVGVTGWVHSGYVGCCFETPASLGEGRAAHPNGVALNLRSAPGFGGNVNGSVPSEVADLPIANCIAESAERSWCETVYNGRRGWISTRYLAVSPLVGDPAADQAQRPEPPSAQANRPLNRADIALVQDRLHALGYDVGSADGIAGARTLAGVSRYQTENGLVVTGQLDRALLSHIKGESQTATSSDSAVSAEGEAEPPPSGSDPVQPSMLSGPFWREQQIVSGGRQLRDDRGQPVPSQDQTRQLAEHVLRYVVTTTPELLSDNQFALAALALVPSQARATLLRERGFDADLLKDWKDQQTWEDVRWSERIDEFDRRALVEAMRERGIEEITAASFALPLSVLVICQLQLGEYDFERSGFSIEQSRLGCENIYLNEGGYGAVEWSAGQTRIVAEAKVPIDRLPSFIEVPETDARSFRETLTAGGAGGMSGAVLAVEADLTALREAETSRGAHRLSFDVDVRDVHVMNEASTEPIRTLGAQPLPSAATVAASPTRPPILHPDTLNVLAAAFDLIPIDASTVLQLARARADVEAFPLRFGDDFDDVWPPFFDPAAVGDIARGSSLDESRQAGFASWMRARAETPPDTIVVPTRTATLEHMREDATADGASIFPQMSSGSTEPLERVAQQLDVPAGRLFRISPYLRGQIPGIGEVEVFFLLPDERDAYRVSLPADASLDGRGVETILEARAVDMWKTDDGEGIKVALAIEPVAAHLRLADGDRDVVAEAFYDVTFDEGVAPRLQAAAVLRRQEDAAQQVELEKKVEASRQVARLLADKAAARLAAARERAATADDLDQRADLAGIRLGMPFADADRLVREVVDVGWASEIHLERSRGHNYDPSAPFAFFRAYTDRDGDDHLLLHTSEPGGGHVVAVSRALKVQGAVSKKDVFAQLKEKYGEPAVQDANLETIVWTEHLGSDPADAPGSAVQAPWEAGSALRTGGCNANVRWYGYAPRAMEVMEGQGERDGRLPGDFYLPEINILGGATRGASASGRVYDPQAWESCGPTVIAEIAGSSRGLVLAYALFDLAAYAENYGRKLSISAPAERPRL